MQSTVWMHPNAVIPHTQRSTTSLSSIIRPLNNMSKLLHLYSLSLHVFPPEGQLARAQRDRFPTPPRDQHFSLLFSSPPPSKMITMLVFI